MATITSPVRRRILAGAFAASLAFALLAPVAAYAANTASFSSRVPASGAHTGAARPSISVIAYDRYGIKGTGSYAMYVDGHKVTPKATYLITGSWNPSHPDYRRVRLTYVPPSALTAASHTVRVTIHDLRSRNSSTTWRFTVDGPYKASFSSPSPTRDSTITATRPTLSLTAYDKYGVSGSGKVTMTIDGAPCVPTVGYTTSKVHTGFKVTYAVPSALGVGTHTVRVGITDLKGNSFSYGWSFKVAEAPLLPMPTTGTACADCHATYAASHPMTNCPACHGPSSPTRPNGEPMNIYSASEHSAHTTACATGTCHRGGGTFPHVLETDCAHCHDGSIGGIPGGHSLATEGYHDSTTPFCIASGCHVSSLTLEHYRRVVDGVRLSCGTCHASTDPAVRAAITGKVTTCTACHDFSDSQHPVPAQAHVTPAILCTDGGCHAGNAAQVHNGKCRACHGTTPVTTTTCTDCHAPHDHNATPTDAVIRINGASYGPYACSTCHESSDLVVIHAGGDACAKCHAGADVAASATPWLGGCAQGDCHKAGTALAQHGAVGPAHLTETAPTCAATNCHTGGSDVAAIHKTQGCATCHGVGRQATLVCATSGCHGTGDTHPIANPHPKMTVGHTQNLSTTCVTSDCHVSADLAQLHAPGPTCAPCHGVNGVGGTLTKGCQNAGCHDGDVPTIHSKADAKHATAPGTCITVCHTGTIANIHESDGTGSGCRLCHDGVRDLTELSTTACSNCHTPYDVPTIHAFAGGSHSADDGTCVNDNCHKSDVTALHGKQGGPGCAACHGLNSVGKTVDLDCGKVGCHPGAVSAQHLSAESSHTIAPADVASCVGNACHVTDISKIHENGPNCLACHSAGKTPSNACAASTCHRAAGDGFKTFSELHVDAQSSHASNNLQCAIPTCHPGGSDASAIHGSTDSKCAACHAPTATLTIVCATCHNGVIRPVPLHASAESSHTAPTGTCVKSGCHEVNVVAIHASGPGCVACHGEGKTPSVNCSAVCHSSDPDANHVKGATPHTIPRQYCTDGSYCHGSNIATLHEPANKCATCHFTGTPVTQDCATVGCHDGFVSHITAEVANHTAARGTCVTSKCHWAGNAEKTHRGNCLACHRTGEAASVNGLNCVACHFGSSRPVPTPVPTHSSATTSHTADYGVCVNDSCHPANVMTIHVDADGKRHCEACHADGKTPTKVCATCHTGDPLTWPKHTASKHNADPASCIAAGCHAATLPAVHAALPGDGCPTCHAQDAKYKLSRVCADCHAGDYTSLHADGDVPHATPNATCIKTDCHPGVITIHVGEGKPGCIACHDPLKTLTVACGGTNACHFGINLGKHNADTLASGAHIAGAGMCVVSGCHKTNLEILHKGQCARCHGVGATPSKVCSNCHTNASVLTLHAVHEETTHTVVPGTTCADGGVACHSNDVSVIHQKPATVIHCDACHTTTGVPAAVKTCATCHAGGFDSSHPVPTVHDATPGTTCVQSGCHNVKLAVIHADSALHACACHEAGKPKTADCTNALCHPTGSTSADHRAHVATVDSQNIVINGHDYGSFTCTLCHINELQQLHGEAASCAKCHAGTDVAATATPWNNGCVQGDCHKADTAAAPHSTIDSRHTMGVAPTCTASDCHAGGTNGKDVAAIHTKQGCATCHGSGKTPTLVCASAGCHAASTSHPDADPHPAMTAGHTVDLDPGATCIKAGCHSTRDLAALHSPGPKCVPCHGANGVGGTLVKDCNNAACHGTLSGTVRDVSDPALHPEATMIAKHDLPADSGCTGTGCHSKNVPLIHDGQLGGVDAQTPSCAACHAADKPALTLSCFTVECHSGGGGSGGGTFPPGHPAPAEKHTVAASGCATTGCHGTDAALLHTTGTTGPPPGCGACHPGLPGRPQPVPPVLTCATCHSTGAHPGHASCNVCHGGSHYGVPLPAIPDRACSSTECHGSPFNNTLSGWNHDQNSCGTNNNCHHEDPWNEDYCHSCHYSSGPLDCYDCHPWD